MAKIRAHANIVLLPADSLSAKMVSMVSGRLYKIIWIATWTLLGLGSMTITAVALNPDWRARLQAVFVGDDRQLLATVNGDLLADGTNFKILKFGTKRGIIVEVLAPGDSSDDGYSLVDRIFIPDPHDGFFSLNTHATRLALVDVDGDGRSEILAPSFDSQLVAHLNTLRLDPDTRRLELVRPPPAE